MIKKKILPEYFDAVASGEKKYELRLNDFAIGKGDVLFLEEWDPKMQHYTGRSVEKKVTYVGKFKIDRLFGRKKKSKKKEYKLFRWSR